MHVFNWADFAIVAIIVISVLISLFRGFIREILSLVIWAISLFAAFKFSGKMASVLEPHIQNPSVRIAVGFAVVFLVILILGDLLAHLLTKFTSKKGLNGIDRTFGMIFGFVRGVFLVAVLLLLVTLGGDQKSEWMRNSYLIPHFQGLVHWLHSLLPVKITSVSGSAAHSLQHAASVIPKEKL